MNLKEFSKFIRVGVIGVQKAIYSGDWKDLPRSKKLVSSIDKNGKNHKHLELVFDKDEVLKYFETKYGERFLY